MSNARYETARWAGQVADQVPLSKSYRLSRPTGHTLACRQISETLRTDAVGQWTTRFPRTLRDARPLTAPLPDQSHHPGSCSSASGFSCMVNRRSSPLRIRRKHRADMYRFYPCEAVSQIYGSLFLFPVHLVGYLLSGYGKKKLLRKPMRLGNKIMWDDTVYRSSLTDLTFVGGSRASTVFLMVF